MGRLVAGCFVLSLCLWHTSHGWLYREAPSQEEENLSNKQLMSLLRDVKRTNWMDALCGKWDDWCVPDQSKPGLACCSGYTCKCNLWNTNCRCKSKLFTG